MTLAIETRDLEYRAGPHFAIERLSLRVPVGAIYGFLGPNGSGKTSTIKLLLGLLRPLSGTITLLGGRGRMPGDAPRLLARIGYVPEQPHLDPTFTVGEMMAYHGAFYLSWDPARAESLRRQFELRAEHAIGRLSKGQKAKLMILLALAQRAELLVLDEPTDGLDPVVRRDILAALIEYVSERQATVFISSHLIHELERICDWIAVMDEGRLVTEVPMAHLKDGIKRLHVSGIPAVVPAPPFTVLARHANGAGETWVVRDWMADQAAYFAGMGAALRDVIDLDLEDSFVELLRHFRAHAARKE